MYHAMDCCVWWLSLVALPQHSTIAGFGCGWLHVVSWFVVFVLVVGCTPHWCRYSKPQTVRCIGMGGTSAELLAVDNGVSSLLFRLGDDLVRACACAFWLHCRAHTTTRTSPMSACSCCGVVLATHVVLCGIVLLLLLLLCVAVCCCVVLWYVSGSIDCDTTTSCTTRAFRVACGGVSVVSFTRNSLLLLLFGRTTTWMNYPLRFTRFATPGANMSAK